MNYSSNVNIPKPSSNNVNQIFEEMSKKQQRKPSSREENMSSSHYESNSNKMEYNPHIDIPGTSNRRPITSTNMMNSNFGPMTRMAHKSSGDIVTGHGKQLPRNNIIHTGVQCDGCGVNPMKGLRFKCRSCKNYDLCKRCSGTRHLHHTFLVINRIK